MKSNVNDSFSKQKNVKANIDRMEERQRVTKKMSDGSYKLEIDLFHKT